MRKQKYQKYNQLSMTFARLLILFHMLLPTSLDYNISLKIGETQFSQEVSLKYNRGKEAEPSYTKL